MKTTLKHLSIVAALLLAAAACKPGRQASPQPLPAQGAEDSSKAENHALLSVYPPSSQADEEGRAPAADLLHQLVARGTSEILIRRTAYTTSYNKQRRTPNWVAWTLTAEHTRGQQLRDDERFEEDPQVPQPRATYQDYYNSRYDRGHMCPAGDNKWSPEAMTQTFLMTNICPQNHGLNKEDWNQLEMQCRTWARRYGQVVIVCGPLYEGDAQPRTIGRNKVQVPTGFFKVVYRAAPTPQAVAFIFKNNGSSQPWKEQACTVDEAERRSGIDFLHQLPNDVEDLVEARMDLDEW